ncbi:MAG: thioredoxin family protein [Chloroflexi bacterium]|nr:thioredoxin family protein [Chloroflexota bacterium]
MLELNRDNYESEVLESGGATMVDFWGPQCRPCLALTPAVEQLEKDYAGKLKVGKVNATQNRMLCAKLRVMSLPTFLFYKDKTEVKRLTGEHINKNDLEETIKDILEAESTING